MIKAGNWVNVIINVEDGKVVHNRIAKCHHVWNGLVYYFNGDRIVYAIEENVEKLPVKFKGFEVKQVFYGSWGFADGVSEHRKIIQGNSHAKFFTESVDETMKLFIGHVGKPHSIKSNPMPIIQARDWLELQYATLIAKARNLI